MHDQDLIAFAQALVRIQSLSGSEDAVATRILTEMRDLNFDNVWLDANGSVIGVIRGAQPGPTLLLDGHCDTVGIAEGSSWTRDPFGGEVDGGYLYGRGAADMKGALAAMIYAAARVDRATLAGQVAVSATVLEEVMEGVSLRAVVEALQPAGVVIGEATQLNLNRGGRGRAEIQLETLGRPAHSSSPELGINAVTAMRHALQVIEAAPLPTDPFLGPAILALTDIVSDPYPGYSVIPSRCRVTFDRRLLPGERAEDVLAAVRVPTDLEGAELRASLAQGEHRAYTGAILSGPKFFPAWVFGEAHPFVQRALMGLRASGLDPQIRSYRFCTNGACSAGHLGIPTVGFGPAAEGDAHVVDERLSIDELIRAAQGYRGLVEAVLSPLQNEL